MARARHHKQGANGYWLNEFFRKFARVISELVGSPVAFILALSVIAAWATLGPYFNYSDTWQLVINTATTIVTFMMVFLIQNTQNRDAKAIHLKLDELLRGVEGARTGLVNLEELSDDELERLHEEFERLRERSTTNLKRVRHHLKAKAENRAAQSQSDDGET